MYYHSIILIVRSSLDYSQICNAFNYFRKGGSIKLPADGIIRIQWKLQQHRREFQWWIIDMRTDDHRMANNLGLIGRRKSWWRTVSYGSKGDGRGKGRGTVVPPSIDNYSFRRVARRGQISILKRRPEKRPGEKCPVPKRYEISGVVSPFVVVHSPPAQEEATKGTEGEWRP